MDTKLNSVKEVLENFTKEEKFPGLSVHIVSKGETILTYDHGYSNIQLEKLMGQDTISSIMSVSKGFTAIAMLHLEENTHFNMDVPVVEYLPYFKTKSGKYDQITPKQILSHTAGFPDDIWLVTLLDKQLFEFAKGLPNFQFIFEQFPNIEETLAGIKSREDVVKYFSNIDLTYNPGEGWLYSTDAYVILADILEKISGMTWEEYIFQNVIKPLGLENTYINPLGHENLSDYYLFANDNYIKLPTPHNPIGAPVGFIYSTAKDMGKYLTALMGSSEKIISSNSREKMFSMIANREPGLSYGLGWKVKLIDNIKVVEHAGGYPGVSSFASMIPEQQFGLMMLCNTGDIPLQIISDKIVDIFIK